MTRKQVIANLKICQQNTCGNYLLGDRCVLFRKPCCIMTHLLNGEPCPLPEPPFDRVEPERRKVSSVNLNYFSKPTTEDVSLVTFHYNPCQYSRLKETYYEWIKNIHSLTPNLVCYELVFDKDEPEIDNSIVIRGSREKNLMWQKEALVNIALKNTTSKYFAWVDHDIIFENTNWLNEGIEQLKQGKVAVQLFSRFIRLDRYNTIQSSSPGAVAGFGKTNRSSNPGGAWVSTTEFMKSIGGLNLDNLFGGGDQTFLDGLVGEPGWHLCEYPEEMQETLKEWIFKTYQKVLDRPVGFVNSNAYHLWHGDPPGRQYRTRYDILRKEGFNPKLDVKINDCGILEWSSDKRRLHRSIARFFKRRKEDG